jgi:hypothetical protein
LRQRTKKKGPLDSASLMDVFEDKGKGKEKRRRGSSITSGTAYVLAPCLLLVSIARKSDERRNSRLRACEDAFGEET